MSAYTAPSFTLATSIPQRGVSTAVLLVGVRPSEKASDKGPKVVDAQLLDNKAVKSIEAALKAVGATGSNEQLTRVAVDGLPVASVLAVGLGSADNLGPEAIRRAAGVAARSLDNVETLVTTLSERDVDASVQGLVLGGYRFVAFRSTKTAPKDTGLQKVTLLVGDKGRAQKEAMDRGLAVASAVATARDFVNTPPSHLFPAEFAKQAKALATAEGIEVEVLDEKELAKAGYGGIVGVGKGSSRPPRLVRLTYRGNQGKKARSSKKVALVGKGITFDTGGISIKPAGGMENMTSDMGGAAAVIAVTLLAARQQLPLDVIATVPMAENMPSSTAQRPGDVLTQLDGTTIEVINTDAEGRLILADAIVRACQDEPDYLIDTATLTGAQVVALGLRTPGVMGTDEFRDRVATISQSVGENGWPMPLPEELRDDLKSRVADMANVTNHRNGGMLAAGQYLREFVADGVQWAHIDVAGPAFNTSGPWGYTPKGGTGVPVRTIFGVLEDIAKNG
ncbi:leucyl aminopeptidase [Mycobacterium sp. CBMA271]|uniref:leucyl aminopeptidase n=1 Tax=unclassified Mycobacteroides TaxID=2618759 RepID=UPI0012DEC88C|nr:MULTISPECIES: leucyl aminopeptidase [unclassified Mycobacteroides]MUM18594.1 leucyl aminopeptidase [Mycobacteroides sp. CBMA 326]MUM22556.1 leucyl aminopeptidase [Mycobacteroides sp. CBMA 271]